MTVIPKDDRLLFFTRLILNVLIVLTAVIGAVVALLIPVFLLGFGDIHREMADSGVREAARPWLALLMAMLVAGLALAFLFLRHLRRIVGTVSDGDPFVPVNADRLRAMAWLALAMQGLAVLATPLIIWFDALPHKPNVHHNENGISFGSLVLALLLFVLARVFRVGSQMREELEGTV